MFVFLEEISIEGNFHSFSNLKVKISACLCFDQICMDVPLRLQFSKHSVTNLCIFQAVAKTLTVAQLFYLREQFALLGPNKGGYISLQNFKAVSFDSPYSFMFFNVRSS